MAAKKTTRKTTKKTAGRSAGRAPSRGRGRTSGKSPTSGDRRWSRKVTTESTHPPEDLFKKDAETIARTLADRRVSPKGIGSGIRMVQFYINRAGKTLTASRRRELERAKRKLQERKEQEKARA